MQGDVVTQGNGVRADDAADLAQRGSAPASFELAGQQIGGGARCLLIAEVGQAHDGSLGTAHAYIDAASRAGADAVKFQTHIAAAESTAAEQFRVRFSQQDASRYEYWRRMEFTAEQWAGLAKHARDAGLIFLSSPFSPQAVELLDRLDVPGWKIRSGEVTNTPLLDQVAATRKPVLLSSGMSSFADLDAAANIVLGHGAALGVFQCATAYPCPPEQWGLNVLLELKRRYGVPTGLSDHSGQIFASLAAAALGADMLELHIVFSRECFGPDVPASVTTDELWQIRRGLDAIHLAMKNPVDKNALAGQMGDLRTMFGKSIVAAVDLPAGRLLVAGDVALKKPGHGLAPNRLNDVIGRVLKRPLTVDSPIQESDLD